MTEANKTEIAHEEALLIARMSFLEALRSGADEDEAESVFKAAYEDALN